MRFPTQTLFKGTNFWLIWGIALLTGCQSSSEQSASISGEVTYQNKPVTGGTLTFHIKTDKGEKRAFAIIEGDGSYQISKAFPGQARITVETETLKPLPNNPPPKPSPDGEAPTRVYMEIPAKYADPETSKLDYEIKSGNQIHNIELE